MDKKKPLTARRVKTIRRSPIPQLRQILLTESRYQCSICGSKSYLEVDHIKPISFGGESTLDNLLVLCPTCHSMVDRSGVPSDILSQIKNSWVAEEVLGKDLILEYAKRIYGESYTRMASHLEDEPKLSELANWTLALDKYKKFDRAIKKIAADIESVSSETDFLKTILKPLFESLEFEGVTVLHHTGRPEKGKDMVFYGRDRLGCFSFYAVVATIKRIHADSSLTHDSGHFKKILDQISKCFLFPHEDHNLKGEFYIDKVIVASASTITEEANEAMRQWERDNRRHLIYLSGPDVAGMLLKHQVAKETHHN
jgi:hypothetical protein